MRKGIVKDKGVWLGHFDLLHTKSIREVDPIISLVDDASVRWKRENSLGKVVFEIGIGGRRQRRGTKKYDVGSVRDSTERMARDRIAHCGPMIDDRHRADDFDKEIQSHRAYDAEPEDAEH